MIVQCNECSARFKLDDSKVTEKGVRVRCSKCKAVFVVKKEAPQEEDFDSLLSGLGGEEEATPTTQAPAPSAEAPAPHDEFSFDADHSEVAEKPEPEAGAFAPEAAADGFKDFDFGEESFTSSFQPEEGEAAAPKTETHDEFSFDETELPSETSGDLFATGGDETAFDFSEPLSTAAEPVAPTATEPPAPSDFTFDEEPFSFDEPPNAEAAGEKAPPEPDVFGEFTFGEPEEPKTETPAEAEDFSFGLPSEPAHDEKPEEFSFGDEDSASQKGSAASFDDFDLGLPEAPSATAAPAPAAHTETKDDLELPPSVAFAPMSEFAADEAPSPAVSRRQGSSGGRKVLLAVLLVLIVAGGGFYLTKLSPSDLDKLGLGAVTKHFRPAEDIRLEIRNVQGGYVKTPQAGELFVVRGEVANNGNRPRTGIQVKASIFGKGGAELGHRIAFCGNPLTDQQIATQPFPQLEKTMNDQFGKSLSNLGLEPGKSVPFTVVLNNVPADAVQYGAELAASAPAGK